MAIYYILIIVLTVIGYAISEKESRVQAIYLAGVFLCFTFVASFRYAIGFDYFSYQNIYKEVVQCPFGDILRLYWHEPLFFMICKLFGLFGCSYQVFLLGINLFLFFAVMNFIHRYSKVPWMSVYLYITLQFLAYNMNLIRQSVAVVFFLFAYPSLRDRRIVPFTIMIFIGGMFHNSILLFFPLFFLLQKKNTAKTTAMIIAAAVLLYFLFDPVFHLLLPHLPEKFLDYFKSYFWAPAKLYYVVPSAIYCVLVYIFKNRIGDPVKQKIYLNSALYSFLISFFITKHFILERFSIYPFALSLAAVPEVIYSFQTEKNQSRKHMQHYHYIVCLFLLFGAAYFLFAAAKGYHHVYPYVSLLDKSVSSPN